MVVVTGDRGESLYDHLDIMGHGDQLGKIEGIAAPWIVFGAGKHRFSLNRVPHQLSVSLDPSIIYLQTDLCLAETPKYPSRARSLSRAS
ncbi:hypothetical protein [Pajaroellobacter abortibovis]|uniref:Uncharacterized protein n=1 Tax=Pajaroellobacter abortibovis TaxID=1882918 RepID=A0A1L6MXM8_9BACT|nr:hypothetical protein [Pajaroellobacter abortibovis]APS00239.1 hypothetical protein BCY86_05740 [Pajaroellobacter abortibovis]